MKVILYLLLLAAPAAGIGIGVYNASSNSVPFVVPFILIGIGIFSALGIQRRISKDC
jgi:hypothetical protein